MEKCKYCGKPYKPNNPNFLKMLSAELQEKLKYIPDCDCFEKEKQAEYDKLEQQRVQDCIKGKLKTFRDISIIDGKIFKKHF